MKRHDYLPFGEELTQGLRTSALGYNAPDGVRQKFTSKERDAETGLDYFGARDHSSTQGRFTSVDLIMIDGKRILDPQRINQYAYTRGNPLAYVDPDGADPKDPKVLVVVFGGGHSSVHGSESTTKVTNISAGGSTEGLGESKVGSESGPIAQQIKNDYPQAEVLLAGPDAGDAILTHISQSKPDNILITGYSAGAVTAVNVTNDLTAGGQKVDQLITVDVEGPAGILNLRTNTRIDNPGMVNDAVNFVGPSGNVVDGASQENISPNDRKSRSTPYIHTTALDIASPRVIKRVEGTLNLIYNPHPVPDRTKLPDGTRVGDE